MGGIQPQGVKKDKGVRVIIAESLRPSLQCAKSAKKANDVIGQLPDLIEEANSTTSFKNGSDNWLVKEKQLAANRGGDIDNGQQEDTVQFFCSPRCIWCDLHAAL